jgi:predicted HTH domain antitoxin
MQVTVDIPQQYLVEEGAGEWSDRLKLYTAILMFHSGKFSAGAACEFAGVDRYTFMAECRRHGIPVVDYPEEELDQELEALGYGAR